MQASLFEPDMKKNEEIIEVTDALITPTITALITIILALVS